MNLWWLWLIAPAVALIGDNLEDFKDCVHACNLMMMCDTDDVLKTIHDTRIQQIMEGRPGDQVAVAKLKRKDLYFYDRRFFQELYRQHPMFDLWWLCAADCNYKCQQIVTHWRQQHGEPMVKFYGKWPFTRWLGMQEFFLAIFSFANFYVNWLAVKPVLRQVHKNSKSHIAPEYARILRQFLYLILGLMVGWLLLTVFHIRDIPATETLDYFGAFAIVLLNFNAIGYRLLKVWQWSGMARAGWHLALLLVYVFHCTKLYLHWDYGYNTRVNLVFGLAALAMWVIHSLLVKRALATSTVDYSSLAQLMPFETALLNKLKVVGIKSSGVIPYLPILLNIVMLLGLSFELRDRAPWFQMIDAHAMWHLFTIWPPLLWYDWNIWDVELLKLRQEATKAK